VSIRATCSVCGRAIDASDNWSGKTTTCPQCDAPVTFPFVGQVVPPSSLSPTAPPQHIPFTASVSVNPAAYPASHAHVTIEHRVKASGGAFKLGFGIVFGALTAIVAFGICAMIVNGITEVGEKAIASAKEPRQTSERDKIKSVERTNSTPSLNYVAVLSARYFRDVKGPMIELKVRNKGDKSVKTVHFHATLKSPDREKPWAEQNFTYSPDGGLGAEETDTWTLEAGRDSNFRSAKPTNNATLTVTMNEVDFVE
jgi:hypothetical protein